LHVITETDTHVDRGAWTKKETAVTRKAALSAAASQGRSHRILNTNLLYSCFFHTQIWQKS